MIAFAAVSVVLTLAVLAVVVLPLLRGVRTVADRGDFDRAVYRDQLAELDRDLARGLIGQREAQAAQVEIQRRLLATDASQKEAVAPRRGGSPRLALAVTVLVAAGSAGLYLSLGSPALRDIPFAGRPAQPDIQMGDADAKGPHVDLEAAAQQIEEKLKTDPNNREGWELYARTEAVTGNWKKSLAGYQHAIDLGAKGADIYESYGEMQVLAGGGIVSPAARDAFNTALQSDPKSQVARYYLALADSQAGEEGKAIGAWLLLAAEAPDDSPMHAEISRNIASAAQMAGIPAPTVPKGTPEPTNAGPASAGTANAGPASAGPASAGTASAGTANAGPGPTPEQVANADDMSPADREKMIRSMIAKLADRLQKDQNDLEGWIRLGQSYSVLGDINKAVDAFDHATKLKPDDLEVKLKAVSALLSQLKRADPMPPRAVALLQEVAAREPEEPEVLWYLGVVALRSGRAEEARQDWTRLLTALPKDGDDYKTVQAALAELKVP